MKLPELSERIRNLLLIVGGLLIVITALFTLPRLADPVVFRVLVPGFAAGLICLALYWLTGDRPGQ